VTGVIIQIGRDGLYRIPPWGEADLSSWCARLNAALLADDDEALAAALAGLLHHVHSLGVAVAATSVALADLVVPAADATPAEIRAFGPLGSRGGSAPPARYAEPPGYVTQSAAAPTPSPPPPPPRRTGTARRAGSARLRVAARPRPGRREAGRPNANAHAGRTSTREVNDTPDEAAAEHRSSSRPDLEERVRRALGKPGRLLFNPPDRMQLRETQRVEVRVAGALDLDEDLLADLRGRGTPHLEQVPTAPVMAVTLRGDGFRIVSYSDEEQSVSGEDVTTWEYDITAQQRGRQRLVISVSLRIPEGGRSAAHRSIPVREATIDVQVRAPALIGQFLSANWQWITGTVIAIAAIVSAVVFR
jgi:hypothetical protein